MCITLNVRDDVSVNHLMELAHTRLIVKTPHVGNSSPNNCYAAKCGFQILLVDSTIPTRDTNANPHLLIRAGKPEPLCDDERLNRMLTPNAKVTSTGFEEFGFTRGRPLQEGHVNRLRSVFPNTDVLTTSEHYRKEVEMVHRVFEIATNTMPHRWYRVVQDDGTIRQFEETDENGVRSWADIRDHLHLSHGDRGWVVPNQFAILFDAVRQSVTDGAPEAWMLSGPDMIKYLPGLIPELRIAYDAVRRKLNLRPELVIHLVPFTHFRFTVRESHKRNVDALLAHVASGSRNRRERSALAADCPDLWARTQRRDHFSQHDMKCADDLYAPDELKGLPLKDVHELWGNI